MFTCFEPSAQPLRLASIMLPIRGCCLFQASWLVSRHWRFPFSSRGGLKGLTSRHVTTWNGWFHRQRFVGGFSSQVSVSRWDSLFLFCSAQALRKEADTFVCFLWGR